jgi:cytidyltransferase-like protein
MNICIVSGYFNPIHPGHISMIQDIKAKYPDSTLIAIVNNDYQVKLKDTVPFLDEYTRCEIVQNIKNVDRVFLSIDQDKTIVQSLKHLISDLLYKNHTIIFCNGGDRKAHSSESAEINLCNDHGVEVEYGYGDDKRHSSSAIIEQAYTWMVNRKYWHQFMNDILSELNIANTSK